MPSVRRRPFTDEVTRVSIADLRRAVGPPWRDMTSVALTIGTAVTAVVELVELPCATTFGATKRWLRCRCGAAVMTLGYLDGVGICCRGCLRWKGRDRRAAVSPPSVLRSSW